MSDAAGHNMDTEFTALHGMQRVFIGIPVDRQSQLRISELLKPLKKSSRDIRWVSEDNRHLTLAFLGNIPAPGVESLIKSFDETYRQESSFQCNMSVLTRFPGPTGRIIALVGKASRPLKNIHGATLELLQRSALDCDRREFRPHITLGRINKAKQIRAPINQRLNIDLYVNKITLYKSTLTTSGAIYSALKETLLN